MRWSTLWLPLLTVVCFGQPTPLPMAAREELARPLLLHAESTAAILEPAARALLLYRTAGAWLPLEPSRAIQLYRESFAAARQSSTLRPSVENAILNDLLPLSPSDVLDLLLGAESETQTRIYAAAINFGLLQGDYMAATRAFERAVAAGILPVRPTAHLLGSLPASSQTERIRIFTGAIRFYQAHPDPEDFKWTLADLIARFYAQLPPALVLQAIDAVLTEAEQRETQHPGGSIGMSFGENNISFNSPYDFQLFAVAPALQQLEPRRAADLLAGHSEVAADLKRYPRGLPSLDVIGFYPGKDTLAPFPWKPLGLQLYNQIEEGQSLSSLDMGLEFTISRNLGILGVTGGFALPTNPGDPEAGILDPAGPCPPDVPHRLELARSVPVSRKGSSICNGPISEASCRYTYTFPRASLIQAIAARCTYYSDPPAARAALRDQLELLTQMPAEERIDYLAAAADLYLRLGDSAGRAIEAGFAAAREVYARDLATPSIQNSPKALWPSAEAYRRIIALGINFSVEVTRQAIEEIPDADLRELERVMVARALLGVPVRRYLTVSSNGVSAGDVEVTYDRF